LVHDCEQVASQHLPDQQGLMAKRTNHYDAAFEGYLRHARIPFVVVDEARRAMLNQVSLKSMDFIVTTPPPKSQNLLVDVKGRRFPSGIAAGSTPKSGRAGHKWENWATKDDIDSLLRWQEAFGADFRSMLVFAYEIVDARAINDLGSPFFYRGRAYSFFGVWADEYQTAMHARSESWETVSVRSREYRELRVPVAELLRC
jgi:hypothetical protein